MNIPNPEERPNSYNYDPQGLRDGDKHSNFRWFVVAVIFFITIINYIDRAAISFTLGDLQKELGLSSSALGLILGAFGIGYFLTTLLGGISVDKWGPKKVLTFAVILWALSMFSMAASIGFSMLFLSRILLGISEGPSFPALEKCLANWLPINERMTSLTYTLMAVPISLAIGAPIVTQLIIYFSWQGMFVILGCAALVWLPIWLIYFKNHPHESDRVSQNELAIIHNRRGNILIREGTDNMPKFLWRYFLITPTFKTENILAKDMRLPKQIWRFLLTNKTLLANYYAYFVFGYFLFFFMWWLPEFLAKTYNLDLSNEGWFSTLPWLFGTAFMFIIGRFSDYITKKTGEKRYSRSYPIMALVSLATICVIPLAITKHPSLWESILFISLAVGFSMSVNPNYYAIVIDMVKRRAGTCLGIMSTIFSIAGFIAPVLTGYLVNITGTFYAAFELLIILGLSSVIIVALFHRPDDPINMELEEETAIHPIFNTATAVDEATINQAYSMVKEEDETQ